MITFSPSKLKAQRTRAGISQRELGERIIFGIKHPERSIYEYERGNVKPPLDRVMAMAEALKIDYVDLIEAGRDVRAGFDSMSAPIGHAPAMKPRLEAVVLRYCRDVTRALRGQTEESFGWHRGRKFLDAYPKASRLRCTPNVLELEAFELDIDPPRNGVWFRDHEGKELKFWFRTKTKRRDLLREFLGKNAEGKTLQPDAIVLRRTSPTTPWFAFVVKIPIESEVNWKAWVKRFIRPNLIVP
jgi:transcriptional regulator with XRE-family HTH domain